MRLQWYFRNGRNWKSYRYFLIPLPHLLKNKKRNWGAVFRYPESLQHEFRVDKIFFNRAVPSQEQAVALESARKICSRGIFLNFFRYFIQHCFICRPSDSTVSEDAGIEPRTVANTALAVRRSNHSAKSHPQTTKSHPLRLNLIHCKLNLIHFG